MDPFGIFQIEERMENMEEKIHRYLIGELNASNWPNAR